MRKRTLVSVATLGLAVMLACPAIGEAKDLCVTISGIIVRAKGFHVPAKNTCKPFHGFTDVGDPVSGTACTNKAASVFRLGYTRNSPNQNETGVCTINLPALTTGSCSWSVVFSSNTINSAAGAGSAQVCSHNDVP